MSFSLSHHAILFCALLLGSGLSFAQSEPPLFPPGSNLPQPSEEEPPPLPENADPTAAPLELSPTPEPPLRITRRTQLANSVGRLVSIKGRWKDDGRLGPSVKLENTRVYVRARLGGTQSTADFMGKWDRDLVEVTGRLRFFLAPEGVITSGGSNPDTLPTHYFFFPDEVTVREPSDD